MKKIKLKKLTIKNFKGIRDLSMDFPENSHFILGDNGLGKTTVFDAFIWCLFDKNSTGEKDFSIKPLDAASNVIPDLENIVEAVINEDGIDTKFKKVHIEKWTRPRGQSEKIFSGHEISYFCNDVPLKKSEYTAKVEQICTEQLFKIITNPMYFTSLKWTEQRDLLFKMAGIKSDIDVARDRKDFVELINGLGNKSLVEFKKEVSQKKKKIKEELEQIPARISEIKNTITSEMPDFQQIEKDIAEGKSQMGIITEQIQSEQKRVEEQNKQVYESKQKVENLKRDLQQIVQKTKHDADIVNIEKKGKIQQIETEIKNLELSINTYETTIRNNNLRADALKKENEALKQDYAKIKPEEIVIDDSEFICPTCKQSLQVEDIEQKKQSMIENFNNQKAKKIAEINNKGMANAENIKQLEAVITEMLEKITVMKQKLSDLNSEKLVLQSELTDPITDEQAMQSDSYKQINEQIKALENQIPELKQADVKELEQKREWFLNEISELNKKLGIKDIVDKNNIRIFELENQAKTLSQELATLEKQEFTIEEFTKYKISTVEDKINAMFVIAKFKMYDQQINGGESETCVAMVNGVPFSDVNTGGKIQVGIDIINTLSSYYGVAAPIFIDNRETVTNIPYTQTQIINLYKDQNYKVLTLK